MGCTFVTPQLNYSRNWNQHPQFFWNFSNSFLWNLGDDKCFDNESCAKHSRAFSLRWFSHFCIHQVWSVVRKRDVKLYLKVINSCNVFSLIIRWGRLLSSEFAGLVNCDVLSQIQEILRSLQSNTWSKTTLNRKKTNFGNIWAKMLPLNQIAFGKISSIQQGF